MHCGKTAESGRMLLLRLLRVAHLCARLPLPPLCVHENTPHPALGRHLTSDDLGNRMRARVEADWSFKWSRGAGARVR